MRLGSPRSATAGLLLLVLLVLGVGCGERHEGDRGDRQAPPVRGERDVGAALQAARGNRVELERALTILEPEERAGLEFLLKHMPDEDLTTLSSSFLVENITLAFAAWRGTPWGRETPRPVFYRQVLPYACASEDRDPWRRALYDQLLSTVSDCDTALEAVQRLNETVWTRFSIEYVGGRTRVDQSPRQTIAMRAASCTGYSIFLTAAARAVGIPSRVMTIAAWPHKAGNHTWIEVWDADGWHVVGSGEPDFYIDDLWLMDDAVLALRDQREHAIYAASFECTPEWIPARWTRDTVFGENVTDRYVAYGTTPERR